MALGPELLLYLEFVVFYPNETCYIQLSTQLRKTRTYMLSDSLEAGLPSSSTVNYVDFSQQNGNHDNLALDDLL